MDRSFLFQPEVIAASRQFVNIRLLSYENKAEAELLRQVTPTRSGDAENTVFALVSPDAKQYLSRSGRSAGDVFVDAMEMAAAMNRLAKQYPAKNAALPPLPVTPAVRLALNVAAAEDRPLVVLHAREASAREKLEDRLRALAWSEAFIGRFIYAVTADAKELAIIEGATPSSGLLVIQPDEFGLKGKVLAAAAANAVGAELEKTLRDGAARHRRSPLQYREHVRAGHESGVFWETALPVTDLMERMARERRPR